MKADRGLIQTEALLDALDQGLIRGAAIDVLTKERNWRATPDEPLLAMPRPNLIVTPHNAWGASESRAQLIDQLCENHRGVADEAAQRSSAGIIRRVNP